MEIPLWITFALPLLSMALVFVPVPGSVSATGNVVEASTLELPAMIHTPTDLGFGGMAAYPIDHVEEDWQTPEETVEEFVYRHGIPEQRANDVFAKSGLLQRYAHEYVLRYPNDPVPQPLTRRRVSTSVFEFAEESPATKAFDPLARLLSRGTHRRSTPALSRSATTPASLAPKSRMKISKERILNSG